MKKYFIGLLLLLTQNVCAMELCVPKKVDPFAIIRKNDEKCKLVAKYVYKYPQGRNDEEAEEIYSFLYSKKLELERGILALRVKKYLTVLDNMEAEEAWRFMYEKHCCRYDDAKLPIYENVPNDLKRTILNEVLYDCMALYCANVSTLEFLDLDVHGKSINSAGTWSWISCLPHFFLEVTEGMWDIGHHSYKCDNAYIGLNCDDLNQPLVHYFLGKHPFQSRLATQELISFLNAKDERIKFFKQTLADTVASFLTTEKIIVVPFGTFIDVLQQIKDLLKLQKSIYERKNSNNHL